MTSQPTVAELLRSAQAAQARGVALEADRAYRAVLAQQPQQVEALGYVAARCLASAQLGEAERLYRELLAVQPQDDAGILGLARCRLAAGDAGAARGLLADLLARQPDAFVARFHYAEACEHAGDAADALAHYFRAISDAQARGRWLNDATTHPSLRVPLQRAMARVDQGRYALYQQVLEPLRQRYGAAALRRVERCLRIYLHMEPADYPDARQRPNFLYFPELPTTPYLPTASMPWLDALQACTAAIREEMLAQLDAQHGFEPFLRFHKPEEVKGYLTGRDGKGNWNAYFFYRHGERYDDNCARCPQTAAALDAAPLLRIREHAPEICYSLLTPGSHILPHRGVTNTRIVVHLPLLVPPDAALDVGGERHAWQEGRAVAFDDTYEHEAWNRSESNRVIVLMDAWNPWLDEAERAAVADLVVAIGEFGRRAGQELSLA